MRLHSRRGMSKNIQADATSGVLRYKRKCLGEQVQRAPLSALRRIGLLLVGEASQNGNKERHRLAQPVNSMNTVNVVILAVIRDFKMLAAVDSSGGSLHA